MLISKIKGNLKFMYRYGWNAWRNNRLLSKSLKQAEGNKYVEFHPIGFRGPIYLRKNSQDDYTFYEVCLCGEYNLKLPFMPQTIIDCGGNIGLSSVYFALKYPDARIVTIEPVQDHFDALCENIKSYSNIHGVQKGIWTSTSKLKITTVKSLNGPYEYFAAREVEDGEVPDIDAVSILDIMNQYGMKTLDLLKVDIEGIEVDLFELDKTLNEPSHRDKWLPLTKAIAIELHPGFRPGCIELFENIMNGYNFIKIATKGDTKSVCTNFYINSLLVKEQ